MATEGAAPPPPGVVPDFENPHGAVHLWTILTQLLCIPIVTIFVGLRIYTKIFLLHRMYAEDWMCLIAWALAIAWYGIALRSAYDGGGYHMWDVTEQQMDYADMVLFGPTILAVKVSLLLMLIRFFAPYRRVVIFVWVLMWILVAYTIAATIAKACICMPIKTFWLGIDVTHGHCLKQLEIFLTDTVISVVSDMIILILPLAMIGKMHLPLKNKLKVMAILAAGGLACVASIVRLVWVIQYRNTVDHTYINKLIGLPTGAEIAIGLICACLPTIATFVTRTSRYIHGQPPSGSNKHMQSGSSTASPVKGMREWQSVSGRENRSQYTHEHGEEQTA